ncbi:MAG: hypothetical protein Q7N50_12710 [Armatimonadota bacterium]|nr:hypothetical protein [Armatimonadota bacterium]
MKRLFVMPLMLAGVFTLTVITPPPTSTVTLGTKVLRGAAIGYAVKQSAGGLNKFINTITFNKKVPNRLSTKVVPILSVGEKAYVGGAQVHGPETLVKNVKAVWQYEDNFSNNRYRLKVLVPSDSLSPLKISRVPKVGVTALIDVSLAGGWKYGTVGKNIRAGDVLLAAGVAVAIKNENGVLNKAINIISFNKGLATRVVPMASFGEKAYIGGGQVSGSANVIKSVNAVWQYEDYFSSGKFRVKIMVPTTSSNPLKMKRVDGAGVTAVIDLSLARQRDDRDRDRSRSAGGIFGSGRDDNGKHKGWYKGKHKGWYKKGKGGNKIEDKYNIDLHIPDNDDKERD